jgi:Protein of unknown function (DUF3618)
MDEQNARVGAEDASEGRTREIRAEIDRTREDMSETVNEIQERLRPSNLASNAAETVKQAARGTVREIAHSEPVEYASENRVPVAMVGIGIIGAAWLALGRRNGRSSPRYYRRRDYYAPAEGWRSGDVTASYDPADRYWQSREGRPGATAGAGAGTGYDARTSYDAATSYQESDADWRRYPRRAYSGGNGRGRSWAYVRRTWDQNPLVVGAASMVVGALVGLSVPETERENQLMGEARDSMVDTIQGTVREKVEQVQQAATSAVDSVQDAAKNAVGLGSSESDAGTKEGPGSKEWPRPRA